VSDVHTRLTERMSAYVEGELPAEEKAAVEQHLASCIQCRTNLKQFRETMDKLAHLKKKAPRSFLPEIQQQIHDRSRGRFFGRRWMLFGRIPFEWVSLLMIVAMLVYYIVTLRSTPTQVKALP
jgi:predicted anti-sigma-YlaC factor YlaD